MEGGGVYSGGGSFGATFANIGDSSRVGDLLPIGNASLFVLMLSIVGTRIANLGGLSLNQLYDAYGLEFILAKVATMVLLFQFTRYLYTSFYGVYGKRWSPFVFLSILLVVQGLGWAALFYGAQSAPAGANELVDRLRAYWKEGRHWSLVASSVLYVVTGLVAMLIFEASDLVHALLPLGVVAALPAILSISYAKPPPPPPPPKKKEEMRDMREIRGFY